MNGFIKRSAAKAIPPSMTLTHQGSFSSSSMVDVFGGAYL